MTKSEKSFLMEYPKFQTSPFSSIWLEISKNWHTKSQGPKNKCTHFNERESTPYVELIIQLLLIISRIHPKNSGVQPKFVIQIMNMCQNKEIGVIANLKKKVV